MIGKRRKPLPYCRKCHVKRGDTVQVISGAHRGQSGKILQVLRTNARVIIEGVNLIKKHTRKSQNNPKGGIEEREGSIHISNVKLVSAGDARVKPQTEAAT